MRLEEICRTLMTLHATEDEKHMIAKDSYAISFV